MAQAFHELLQELPPRRRAADVAKQLARLHAALTLLHQLPVADDSEAAATILQAGGARPAAQLAAALPELRCR